MVSIKQCNDNATGRMLQGMRGVIHNQVRDLRIDNIISDGVYRKLADAIGNYGIAFINITGISPPYINEVLFAHSKVGKPNSKLETFSTHGMKFIPLAFGPQRFDTLWVRKNEDRSESAYKNTGSLTRAEQIDANDNDYLKRNVCAESKILEYIYTILHNQQPVSGTIHMFTDKHPCISCQGVIKTFGSLYSNLNITVYYDR
ncbi:hypothetical protein CN978_25060 [Priestia megaterium]|uniref:deaminase domain-containing protein n=1 Tax=Priestia megaterium TaxID=1404 RepID=UPI000BFCC59C|nr:deaminase domain-containing protein [Priestia megaterium]PGN62203.1 hypothetical protein CN978_25060 [Priestia megaterium]